ncbi:MAG: hypothetical protein ABI251_07420 [Mycobacteriaceae bacterium]
MDELPGVELPDLLLEHAATEVRAMAPIAATVIARLNMCGVPSD